MAETIRCGAVAMSNPDGGPAFPAEVYFADGRTQIIPGSMTATFKGMIPDGEYEGVWYESVWGDWVVTVKWQTPLGEFVIHMNTKYGTSTHPAPCIVTVKDGQATVEMKK